MRNVSAHRDRSSVFKHHGFIARKPMLDVLEAQKHATVVPPLRRPEEVKIVPRDLGIEILRNIAFLPTAGHALDVDYAVRSTWVVSLDQVFGEQAADLIGVNVRMAADVANAVRENRACQVPLRAT